MAHLSLGSPVQLDDGTVFDDYKTPYDMPSPFPSSFSDADSSPSTQTSSVPSSSFLGYTPPTSDEEGDKDADGEFDTYSSINSPSDPFPPIVSPVPLSHASVLFAWDDATTHHGLHSSQDASNVKESDTFDHLHRSYVFSHTSSDDINATLVGATYLAAAQPDFSSSTCGLMPSLCSADLNHLGLSFDMPRRSSYATELSFGSNGTSSDYGDSPTTALVPLPTTNSSQSITPIPTPTATVNEHTPSNEQQSAANAPHFQYAADQSYFPQARNYFTCSFGDCPWYTDDHNLLSTHNEEHVRNGIFNCPVTTCMKHFTTFTNLEAHRLLEHAFTNLPVAPHTSFVGTMQPEADQYFPPMPSYQLAGQNEALVPSNVFQPYYDIAQSATPNAVGLGFIPDPVDGSQVRAFPPAKSTEGPLENVMQDYSPANTALPRRASDSNIAFNHNGHVSAVAWQNTMPSLQENEVFCSTPDQTTALQSSETTSACSSTLNTPQHSATNQRRVAFPLTMPSSSAFMSEEASQLGMSVPMMQSTSAPGMQAGFGPLQHGDPHGLAARFHAANTAYQEGLYASHHPIIHDQMMAPGFYYSNIHDAATAAACYNPHAHAVNGSQSYGYFPHHYSPHYTTQHVNLASIDPTMALSPAHIISGEYVGPLYPPTLASHMAHQRVVRAALPRRGSESSYLATNGSAHPYASAIQGSLLSKKVVLPDAIGPARNKPIKSRSNLPGPKGQEIPKAYRNGPTASSLAQEGYDAEEVEGINLAEMKLHPCDFEGCCRVFKRLEHKRRHQRSHTQEKPYQCPVDGCKRFFSRSDNLTQHRRTHERNGRTQRLTLANLQQCGSGAGEQENLEKVTKVQAV